MPKSKDTPAHWPRDVQYILSSVYHLSVPAHIQRFLKGSSKPTTALQARTTRKLVAIRLISDPSHPACGQRGLFALCRIAQNTRMLTYTGEVHCDDRPGSDYDLSLYRAQDGINVGVDASRMGNESRFINDYRGISKRPNAVFIEERSHTGELQMVVWSDSQEIKKGDEILVSYGKGWWKARTNVEDSGTSG